MMERTVSNDTGRGTRPVARDLARVLANPSSHEPDFLNVSHLVL